MMISGKRVGLLMSDLGIGYIDATTIKYFFIIVLFILLQAGKKFVFFFRLACDVYNSFKKKIIKKKSYTEHAPHHSRILFNTS